MKYQKLLSLVFMSLILISCEKNRFSDKSFCSVDSFGDEVIISQNWNIKDIPASQWSDGINYHDILRINLKHFTKEYFILKERGFYFKLSTIGGILYDLKILSGEIVIKKINFDKLSKFHPFEKIANLKNEKIENSIVRDYCIRTNNKETEISILTNTQFILIDNLNKIQKVCWLNCSDIENNNEMVFSKIIYSTNQNGYYIFLKLRNLKNPYIGFIDRKTSDSINFIKINVPDEINSIPKSIIYINSSHSLLLIDNMEHEFELKDNSFHRTEHLGLDIFPNNINISNIFYSQTQDRVYLLRNSFSEIWRYKNNKWERIDKQFKTLYSNKRIEYYYP